MLLPGVSESRVLDSIHYFLRDVEGGGEDRVIQSVIIRNQLNNVFCFFFYLVL